jgi:hypothetical protein
MQSKEEIATKPSSFSTKHDETICCATNNQSNVTNNATYVSTSNDGKGNMRKNIINSPPLIKDNVVDEVYTKLAHKKFDPCLGQYIYVYDLPTRFNENLLI